MRNNPSNTPEKKAEYKAKLEAMAIPALYAETKSMVWFSAYASNNPNSCYHWQCDFTYDEWERRGDKQAYGIAHSAVMAAEGYKPDFDRSRELKYTTPTPEAAA